MGLHFDKKNLEKFLHRCILNEGINVYYHGNKSDERLSINVAFLIQSGGLFSHEEVLKLCSRLSSELIGYGICEKVKGVPFIEVQSILEDGRTHRALYVYAGVNVDYKSLA